MERVLSSPSLVSPLVAQLPTWTRDSEEISGGMTVLDNAMTAQYTHTVTVNGRLGGQYVCTVSNNKPSQASASYTVEGNIRLLYL